MSALIEFLSTIVNSILSLVDMAVWMTGGVYALAVMLIKSASVFGTIMRMFPLTVASSIVGVCTGLAVLRIFGRS